MPRVVHMVKGALRALVLVAAVVAATPCVAPGQAADQDRAAILALHERAGQAHFDHDARAFLSGTAETWLRISGGEVVVRKKAEHLPRLQEYLDHMEFDSIEEVRPPIVELSPDRQVAWLIGAVDVRGRLRGENGTVEPVAFRAAFLHVYRKGEHGWERVAEADTQRPLE